MLSVKWYVEVLLTWAESVISQEALDVVGVLVIAQEAIL